MSLQVWLPLTENINNYGITKATFEGSPTIDNNGKIGKCYYFNNSPLIAQFPVTTQFSTNDFSGFFWYYLNSSQSNAYIFHVGGDNSSWRSKFAMSIQSGKWVICINQTEYIQNITPVVGEWHHVGFVNTDTSLKFYIDGVLVSTQTPATSFTPTNYITIGARLATYPSTSFPISGKLNDIRLYNHALTNSEIQEIYNTKVFHYQLNNLKTGIENHHIIFLPTEYQEVQYLESTGTAWIGNIPIEANDEIQVVTEATNNTNSEYSILGSSSASFECYFKNGRINCWNRSAFVSPYSNSICSAFNIISTRFKVTVDCSAYMFGYNGAAYNLIGRIYSLKIYSSEKHLKYKFIPCYRISDHKPGMYEIVHGVFYVNGSSGADFIYGPLIKNIPTGYQPLEYLQNDGTAYINTDIPCRNTLEWECDFCWDQNINNGCCIGGRNGDNRRYVAWFDNVYIYGWNNGYQRLSIAPIVGKWDKIKCSWTASGTKFYLNNTLMHSSSAANPDSASTSTTIGIFGTGQGAQKTKGKIKYAILRISNIIERDLHPALRESDGVAGMYDLVNDIFYTNAASSGSFTYPGYQENVQYNGCGYINSGICNGIPAPTTSARYAHGLYFNKSSEGATIKYNDFNFGNIWSVGVWIYSPSTSSNTWKSIFAVSDAPNDTHLKLNIYLHQTNAQLQFSANGQYQLQTQNIKDKWTHVMETFDGSTLKGYVNGQLLITKSITNAEIDWPTLSVAACPSGDGAANYFQGKLSDFRIYATCLSADEVLKLYKMGHAA